jgi:hypothetical protein
MNREDFIDEQDNYDVWCTRCRRVHRAHFTKQDFDHVIAEGVRQLRERIDADALAFSRFSTHSPRISHAFARIDPSVMNSLNSSNDATRR